MKTYTLTAGTVTWNIGAPGTEETITVTIRGKDWSIPSLKATSTKGVFWIVRYEKWAWRPEDRPFESDCWLGLNAKRKLLVKAALLDTVLWSLATGRNTDELPDCWTTASGGFDDQPQRLRERPGQAQPRLDGGSSVTREAPRKTFGQRMANAAKLLRLIQDHDRERQ
jgi:hypothetical protein